MSNSPIYKTAYSLYKIWGYRQKYFFEKSYVSLKIFAVGLSKIYITLKLIIFKIMFSIIRIMVLKRVFVTEKPAFLYAKIFIMWFYEDIF